MVLVADAALASVVSLWSTLFQMIMAASVRLGRCFIMRQPRISPCLPVFVLAQFALGIWYIISVVLVSGSPCSGSLGVAYEYESWILREMTFLRGCNAWYNCGYMFCVSTLVASEEFTHFLRGGRLVS